MLPTNLDQTILALLAANVPHRIYAKDVAGRFIFANRAVAVGMGVDDPALLLGKTDFDYYPHDEAAGYQADEQRVLVDGEPLVDHEEHANYLLLPGDETWLSTTKVPMRDAAGRIIGLVGINHDITARKLGELALREAHRKADDYAQALGETVARLHKEVAKRRQMETVLRHRALHDDLTGLPNRALLLDRLDLAIAQAVRVRQSATILFLDLDGFKQVNDDFGHAAGDQLLKTVAERIGGCIRAGDTLARLGGDEFVVLLPTTPPDAALVELVERIRRCVVESARLLAPTVTVGCSIGCATAPEHGADGAALLQYADAEMYRAKQQTRRRAGRKSGIGALDDDDDTREMQVQLRHALRRGEFTLHYQPQMSLRTGQIVGVEALIRWQHPEWGMVPPLRFIPVAEACGEIGRIGAWVLREACAQAMRWQRAGLAPVPVAVNLSAQQFLDPGLDTLVAEVLAETGLAPEHLELELTESLSMNDPPESIRILGRFNAMGIRLAIDDFGTGYSNLAYLVRLPIHRLKLDRSFIADLAGQHDCGAVVESVIGMAHRLGLDVVAEGVETDAQRLLLCGYGCDTLQGYWYSRPLAADDCAALLAREASLLLPAI